MANEEQALRTIVEQLEAAWNKGDSVGWTDLFAEDADFIHILGGHFNGQTAIERGHRAIFDTIYKGSTNKFEVEKIRFVGDNVAIVFVFATLKVVTPGLPPQINARPTLIAERRTGRMEDRNVPEHGSHPRGSSGCRHGRIAAQHPIKGQAQSYRTVVLIR